MAPTATGSIKARAQAGSGFKISRDRMHLVEGGKDVRKVLSIDSGNRAAGIRCLRPNSRVDWMGWRLGRANQAGYTADRGRNRPCITQSPINSQKGSATFDSPPGSPPVFRPTGRWLPWTPHSSRSAAERRSTATICSSLTAWPRANRSRWTMRDARRMSSSVIVLGVHPVKSILTAGFHFGQQPCHFLTRVHHEAIPVAG